MERRGSNTAQVCSSCAGAASKRLVRGKQFKFSSFEAPVSVCATLPPTQPCTPLSPPSLPPFLPPSLSAHVRPITLRARDTPSPSPSPSRSFQGEGGEARERTYLLAVDTSSRPAIKVSSSVAVVLHRVSQTRCVDDALIVAQLWNLKNKIRIRSQPPEDPSKYNVRVVVDP